MATSRPATPDPGRLPLVDRDVEDAAVELRVEVVGRVVLEVVGLSEPPRVADGRLVPGLEVAGLEVARRAVAGCGVEPVGAVVPVGRDGDAEVIGADGAEESVVAAVVGVSGSRVRAPVDGPVESSAGTVTSGTVAAGAAVVEPPVALAASERPVPPRVAAEPVGEASPAAPPQAANSSAAMP